MIRRNPIAANAWKVNRATFIPDKKKENRKIRQSRWQRVLDEFMD